MAKLFFLLILLLSCSNDYNNEFEANQNYKLPDYVDYNFHIKPILSDRCFICHGPDQGSRKGNLRLDLNHTSNSVQNTIKNIIIPGNAKNSLLIKRINSLNKEYIMPPPDSKLMVSEYEKALIQKWINQGAEYKEHWSFIIPKKSMLPYNTKNKWVSNEIDHFILEKILKTKLVPSPIAEKEVLIRRLSFDLRGLPPSLEEIESFINDNSKDAYEKVVDKFLSSKYYGERMASDWLSLSRYGDTHGYESDSKRTAWQWRDWVINAFNQNMPYDQFVIEQIAGDLLPNATRDQLIATSFNRNHLMNSENGIIDEEWRIEYVSDRTNTFGKAFMGMTMECAKCHDHKYDPISQKEYYELFAFFNNVDEQGAIRYESQAYPTLDLTNSLEQLSLDSIENLISKDRKNLEIRKNKLKKSMRWSSDVELEKIDISNGLQLYFNFDTINENEDGQIFYNETNTNRYLSLYTGEAKLVEGIHGSGLYYDGINSTVIQDDLNAFEINQPFSFSLWLTFPEPFSRAVILGTDDGSFDKVPGFYLFIQGDKLGFQFSSTWDHNSINILSRESFPFKKWNHIGLTYDGTASSGGVKLFLNGVELDFIVLKDNLSRTTRKNPGWFKIGHYSLQGGSIDELKQYDRVLTLPEIQKLAGLSVTNDGLFDYYTYNKDEKIKNLLASLRISIKERLELLDSIPQLMIMKDLQDSIRPTYVLNRGIYNDLGEKAQANTPDKILKFSKSLPRNRLGLAKWLFDKNNPLTSRVKTNRIWQMLFGKGIVDTPDDFGNQGSLPSHPELLDWLSIYFQDVGWDVKKLIKKIVLSSTYKQSSLITKSHLDLDPQNQLLSRGPRYRLPAEMVRDNVLKISGLLVDKIGGEPVKPYQPDGIWAQLSSSKEPYKQDHGEKLYRRSIYTYWKRAAPPPNMLTFDAPTRHNCVVKREATSTPLQALVLMNDIQFIEAARVLAQKILNENLEKKLKIEKAFRMITSRLPKEKELKILLDLWNESKIEFNKYPKDAEKLVEIGEFPIYNNLDKIELASFTIVTSAIFNLNETITKT